MKKRLQTIRNLMVRSLGIGLLLLGLGVTSTQAQTYLTENFDGVWSGSPSAPSGWTQERIIAVSGNAGSVITPIAVGTSGEKDWQQSTWSGSVWTPTPYGGAPTIGAMSGSSALSIEDGNFNGSSTPRSERRLLSPTIDLSATTSPYVRFWYYNNQAVGLTSTVRIIISNDGGTTWKTLSNVVNGFTTTNLTWNKINIVIPAAYRVVNAKVGIAIVNRWGSNDAFIDDFTVEEFTPTTITSAANGDWNVAATWVGSVVPTADNHVVIAHNVVVTNTASTTGIIARCQNLTINSGATLSHGAGTSNLLHAFGDIDITGTLNSFNGSSGRNVYVNGNVLINSGGVVTMNTSTTANVTTTLPTAFTTGASGFTFLNADAASFTNNGTLTSGRINNIWHMGSGTFTYNSPVGVPYTFALIDGQVNPNGNLTLGNPAASGAQNIIRHNGSFTSAPIYNNTNITQRNLHYFSTNFTTIAPQNITSGEEMHNNSGYIVTGQLQMNTFNNVTLGNPVTIGTSTTGSLTLTKGLIITSNTNLLTTSLFFAPPAGVSPSTATPSTTNGSYIVGPLRVNFPASGTTARNFPLGIGTAFNGVLPTSNARRNMVLSTSTAWASQTITGSIEAGLPSGSVTGSLSKVMGNRMFRLNLNGGPDLASTATIAITGQNNTLGSTDALVGNQNNLFVAQSTTGTSGWAARSASSGSGAFVNGTDYTRTSTTAAPGPIAPLATNGEYFAFGTDAVLMTYTSGTVVRNTGDVSPGAFPNTQMLQVKVTTTGVVPISLTQLNFSTAGTSASALANIDNAKVWYTGASSSFAMTTQIGSTQLLPNGSFSVTGNQVLASGDNYFWLAYDLGAGNVLNDSFAAECASVVVDGITQSLSSPAAGYRISNVPMTYVGSTSATASISKVGQSSTNNAVIRVEVEMSPTGSPLSMTSFDVSTTGTTSLTDITNLKIWSTGTSSTFATTTQFGSTVAVPAASQTVSGSLNLANGINYFWVTYDIAGAAVVNNFIDAECTGINVGGSPQVPSTTAPAGNRQIRAAYCATVHSGGSLMTSVQFGTINNSPSAPLAPYYTLFPASGATTTTLMRGTNQNLTIAYNASSIGSIWIDFNDDGVFAANEWTQLGTAATGGTFSVSIPCSAVLGQVRMRLRSRSTGSPNAAVDACTTFGSGECQEYTVTILDNPLSFGYATTEQQTGVVAPNIPDRQILHVPVRVNGCGVAEITEMRFSYTGTSASDVSSAKLYRTTGTTFNTTNLRQTVLSPSGQFTFALLDTTVLNDTTHYWLAFDIAPGAVISNIIDASFDSLQMFANYYLPTVSTPSGSVMVDAPMSYSGSVVTQGPTSVVFKGETTKHIIGLQLTMSAIGSPINLTSLDINLNGTTDTADIQNIKVWYTGNSSTFAATTQFGSTIAYAPAIAAPFTSTITGSQSLLNNTNYFWVTYDIKAGATPLNVVDGEITQAVVNGNVETPTITAPVGSRQIRTPYCPASATNTADTDIGRIQLFDNSNALIFTNGSELPTYSNPASNGLYSNFAGLTPANLTRGVSHSIRMDQITSGVTLYAAGLIVYIDWNDDGDFLDASETAYTSGGSLTVPATGPYFLQGSFTVPCSAVLGNLRMRVILQENVSSTPSCGTFTYGEVEDYTINIVDNPVTYNYSTSIQFTGLVAPGTNDREVLRVPVKMSGCGAGVVTEMRFSTSGTTNVADILNAKLYRTSGSTFNTTTLIQTIPSPSGQFTFSITDTTLNNDTTNYWLAYDIAGGATLSNIVDATLDSIQILGLYQIPTATSPSGSIMIDAPMTYVSSTSLSGPSSKIERGFTNNNIIGVQVAMSAIGSGVAFTDIELNLNGTTDTADIQNIKVWYTGNSNTFATTTQFGSTMLNAPVVAAPYVFTVSGSQILANGNNYFWITYDVKSGATVGNFVDAECTSVTVAGVPQVPTVTSPTGDRQIRGSYCASAATNTADEEIFSVTVNGATNAYSYLTLAPGPGSLLNRYSNFTTLPSLTTIDRGQKVAFNIGEDEFDGVTYYSFGTAIWIDFNQDGDFDDANEKVFVENATAQGPRNVISTFYVPMTASVGETRMRITIAENISGAGLTPCLSYGYGETEDYTITIAPAPAPVAYVWNQTAPANYTTAANWTPSRSIINMQDALVFNGGSNVTVNNVEAELLGKVTIDNSTAVTMNVVSPSVLATDSLDLTSGKIITGTDLDLTLGKDTVNTGVLLGSGHITGTLSRWISAVTPSYSFPMIVGANSRTATITYTTPPTTSGKLTVTYVTGAPGNSGLPIVDAGLTLVNISNAGVWRATPSGLAGGTFDITAQADSVINVNDYLATALLARANNASSWLAAGTHVTTTGTNTAMLLSRTGLTAYGEIGIAGEAINPLPVTLTSFAANVKGADAILTWTTASEVNNSGFEVQRSVDGRNFEKAGFVKGAGNSNKALNYSLTDAKAFTVAKSDVIYYRLKQVDFDGKFTYSQVVRVAKNAEAANALSVYPNPYTAAYSVSFTAAKEGSATIEMIDLQGKVVATKSTSIINGNNMIPMTEVTNLEAGVYFVRLTINGETQITKLVKN